MDRRSLAALLQRNETAGVAAFLTIDPVSVRRLGLGAARRDGALYASCRAFPIPLFHRVVGFGTIAEPSRGALDRILRHYARLGLPARVEIAEAIAPAAATRALERAGFTREQEVHEVHVLETDPTDRPPEAPAVGGLRVEPVTRRTAALFGLLIRDGFAVTGPLGEFFERASVAHARTYPPSRAVSLIARIDGEPAGTGLLWLTPGVAGLYSGSVLPAFRGRGIQSAVIAERVRLGLLRRRRIFTSQTEGDDPSAHNLHDMGFRTLYRAAYFTRPAP